MSFQHAPAQHKKPGIASHCPASHPDSGFSVVTPSAGICSDSAALILAQSPAGHGRGVLARGRRWVGKEKRYTVQRWNVTATRVTPLRQPSLLHDAVFSDTRALLRLQKPAPNAALRTVENGVWVAGRKTLSPVPSLSLPPPSLSLSSLKPRWCFFFEVCMGWARDGWARIGRPGAGQRGARCGVITGAEAGGDRYLNMAREGE
jgi:hypothetical protein